MKISTFYFILALCLLAVAQEVRCQDSPYVLPQDPTNNNVIPPSPDVWQFIRYGDYPVSRETGVPNISIPIHSITSGELSVPVSLSYHAGGIKVDDMASEVGLGWTLNAGGIITRTIRGGIDEGMGGILGLEGHNVDFFNDEGVINAIDKDKDYWTILMPIYEETYDAEPDVFHYNFSGHTGKFFLDFEGKVFTQPKSDIDFQVSITDHNITEVVARTPDGVTFIFNETTYVRGDHSLASGNVSWYLKEIRSSNGTDTITFYYKNLPQKDVRAGYYETSSLQIKWVQSHEGIYDYNRYKTDGAYESMKLVERIESPLGRVDFNYLGGRQDTFMPRLSSIEVYNVGETSPFKSFFLNNNAYFVSSGAEDPRNNQRLKLVSMQEFGKNGQKKPPYEFTYLETGNHKLPPRESFAQDYWGYYNSNNANSLLPEYYYQMPDETQVRLGTANRSPDVEKMKAGTIKKIKYPTGGESVFTFEPNEVNRSYIQHGVDSYSEYIGVMPMDAEREKETTFSVLENVKADLSYSIGIRSQEYAYGVENTIVEIRDLTSGKLIIEHGGSAVNTDKKVELEKGHEYKIYVRAVHPEAFTTVNLRWKIPRDPVFVVKNETVGGLRIKKIENFDVDGGTVTEKHFSYKIPNSEESSGVYVAPRLPEPSDYVTFSTYKYMSTVFNGIGSTCTEVEEIVVSMTAYPSNRIGFINGNVVNYSYVIEQVEEGQQTSGKSVYKYDVAAKDLNVGLASMPPIDQSWLRGQLLNEFHYGKDGKILKQTQFDYEVMEAPGMINGVKVIKSFIVPDGTGGVCVTCAAGCTDGMITDARNQQIVLHRYRENIQWKRLKSKTETLDGVSFTTSFEYDPDARHTNVTAAETIDSKESASRVDIKYAHELNDSEMLSRHIISRPLESISTINGQLQGGTKVSYGFLEGFYLPLKYQERYSDNSLRLLKEIKGVNDRGRTEAFHTATGLTTSIIWGYNGLLPIAQVENGTDHVDMAYSSFESSDRGNWSINGTIKLASVDTGPARTGEYFLDGTKVSNNNLSTATKYTVSLWAKGGAPTLNGQAMQKGTTDKNGWIYFYSEVSGVSAVDIYCPGLYMDEVRLAPAASLMTTYTHKLGVGVTSITDPNGFTTYYEYDDLGRMTTVKDHQYIKLQNTEYSYYNEQ